MLLEADGVDGELRVVRADLVLGLVFGDDTWLIALNQPRDLFRSEGVVVAAGQLPLLRLGNVLDLQLLLHPLFIFYNVIVEAGWRLLVLQLLLELLLLLVLLIFRIRILSRRLLPAGVRLRVNVLLVLIVLLNKRQFLALRGAFQRTLILQQIVLFEHV